MTLNYSPADSPLLPLALTNAGAQQIPHGIDADETGASGQQDSLHSFYFLSRRGAGRRDLGSRLIDYFSPSGLAYCDNRRISRRGTQ